MGAACGTYGGEEVDSGFWLRNLKERGHFEKLSVEKENKMDNEEMDYDGVDGIDLA